MPTPQDPYGWAEIAAQRAGPPSAGPTPEDPHGWGWIAWTQAHPGATPQDPYGWAAIAAKQAQSPPIQVNDAGYELQRGDIRQRSGAEMAANDYSQTLAQQRHARQLGDYAIQGTRARNSFDNPYLNKGTFRSGIRRQGLSQFREDQSRGAGQLAQNQSQEMANIAQQRAGIQQNQTSALTGVDIKRQQDIFAQLAALRQAGVNV